MSAEVVVLRRTRVRCTSCSKSHAGTIAREGRVIVGRFRCDADARERSAVISQNADLYERITAKSHAWMDAEAEAPFTPRPLLNLIEITDTCNFRCPVCYAGSAPKKDARHLPVEEVLRRAGAARSLGARAVTLTGGEPTEHPDLVALIRAVKGLGLKVHIPTNGIRLGAEAGYARALVRAGLGKASIQFDTFDPETHKQIRGNTFIAEKLRAFDVSRAAGLRLGIIATVLHANVKEAPDVVELGLSHAPALSTVAFQIATPTGRHEIPPGPPVDRESVIERLLERPPVEGIDADRFWPLPSFRPWGMRVHPDCGANLYVLTGGARRQTLDDRVALGRLFEDMAKSRAGTGFAARNLVPALAALKVARLSNYPALAEHMAGFLTGRGKKGMVVVGTGGFVLGDFSDLMRIEACSTTYATPEGPRSPCAHFMS